MTLKRYTEAVRNGEPRYYVDAMVSRAFRKTFVVDTRLITYGPYLRQSTAKRLSASLRKSRTLYFSNKHNDELTDAGPFYSWVKIRVEK